MVVERKLIGGSCPNTNCLPSKNEIWSAKVAELVRHADRFGSIAGAASVDMAKVLARKREMVDGLIRDAPRPLPGERGRTDHGRLAGSSRRRLSK